MLHSKYVSCTGLISDSPQIMITQARRDSTAISTAPEEPSSSTPDDHIPMWKKLKEKAAQPKNWSRRLLRKPKNSGRNQYERMYKKEKFIKVRFLDITCLQTIMYSSWINFRCINPC